LNKKERRVDGKKNTSTRFNGKKYKNADLNVFKTLRAEFSIPLLNFGF
jgi:hypothetical protein